MERRFWYTLYFETFKMQLISNSLYFQAMSCTQNEMSSHSYFLIVEAYETVFVTSHWVLLLPMLLEMV
jgi:hypothetical protein